MVRTGTRTPEEVDGAEAPTAVAEAITVMIAEIIQKKNERRSNFRTNNYWNRAQTLLIQEDLQCSSCILRW